MHFEAIPQILLCCLGKTMDHRGRLRWRLIDLVVFTFCAYASAQGLVTDYAPTINVQCPDLSTAPLIREFTAQNQSLHPLEIEYVDTRSDTILPDAWSAWLGDGSHLSYNVSAFQGRFPNIGLALSGGGLRAAQYGAGTLSGLDARNDSAKAAGTGGLLQVASYISGLSGGSWITGSLFLNNLPPINDLVFGNGKDMDGWKLDIPFVTPDGINIFSDENEAFFGSVLASVISKAVKGLDTSLTDPWARMISYHFLNQTTRQNFFTNDSAHGAGQLWSHIPQLSTYQQHQTPFPIIVADSRPVGSNLTTTLSLEPIVYEITPLEFASYDPNLSAGLNLTYAGTFLSNGKPANDTACVTGFDQAGFVMGTSASLFNTLLDSTHNELSDFSSSDSQGILFVLAQQLDEVRSRADDVANWPNPFNGLKNSTFEDSDQQWLELIDGGSNLENVPLGPLFVKARELDMIVTIDSSADDPVNTWPNGTSLIATAQRQLTILKDSHQQFPPIPQTVNDFVATGVNSRPTFFGCDPEHTPPEYPLVVYLPNSPPITGDDPVTNTDTFKLTYTGKHTQLFLDQAHFNTISGFTPNANTPDPHWGTCLQCAALDRGRFKLNPVPSRSAVCTDCFEQYCYDPQNPPSKVELPNRKLEFVDPDPQGLAKAESFFSKNKFAFIGALAGLVAVLVISIVGLIWWKKRQTKQRVYQRVNNFHDDDPLLQRYADHDRLETYELPAYRQK